MSCWLVYVPVINTDLGSVRGTVVRSIVFTTTMIARLMIQLPLSFDVASLDIMLHDDYLGLVESGKQQIKEVRRKLNRKTWKQR